MLRLTSTYGYIVLMMLCPRTLGIHHPYERANKARAWIKTTARTCREYSALFAAHAIIYPVLTNSFRTLNASSILDWKGYCIWKGVLGR
jgi:hypothetical protein